MKLFKHKSAFTFVITVVFLLTPVMVLAQAPPQDTEAGQEPNIIIDEENAVIGDDVILEGNVITEGDISGEPDEVGEPDEPDETGETGDVITAPPEISDEEAVEAEQAAEVLIAADETVTAQDLGVAEPKVLPGSVLYPFKNLWRGTKVAFTFNKVKKAELTLKHANERIIEAQKIVEEEGDEVSARSLENVMKRYEKDLDKVQKTVDKIVDKISAQGGSALGGDANPQLEKLVDKLADTEIKRHKVIQKLQDKAPEEAIAKILEAKESSAENFGKVIAKAVAKEKIAEKIEAVMDQQKGSEFKNLKNMEVLREVMEHVPEQAKEAIQQAQENALKRFGAQIKDADAEEREKFKKYFEKMSGNEVHHLALMDEMKTKLDLPEEITKDFENMKEVAVKKFENRMKKITKQEIKNRFLDPFKDGDPEDLRAMKQMGNLIAPELQKEMEKVRDQSINAFKEKFIDDPDAQRKAERLKELTRKMEENPDPTTFAMIQEIEESLPPEQKSFAEELKEKTITKFAEKMKQEQSKFLMKISSNDPYALETMEKMKEFAPPEERMFMDQAMNKQMYRIQEHVGEFMDAMHMVEFREKMEDSGAMDKMMEWRPDFDDFVHREQMEVVENNLERFDDPEKMLQFREEFEQKIKMNPEFERKIMQGQPDMFKEFDDRQFRVMQDKIEGFEDPERVLEFKEKMDKKFEENPELRAKILENRPDFVEDMNKRQVEMIEMRMRDVEDPERLKNLKEEIESNGFREDFMKFKPDIMEKINQVQEEKTRAFEAMSEEAKQRMLQERTEFGIGAPESPPPEKEKFFDKVKNIENKTKLLNPLNFFKAEIRAIPAPELKTYELKGGPIQPRSQEDIERMREREMQQEREMMQKMEPQQSMPDEGEGRELRPLMEEKSLRETLPIQQQPGGEMQKPPMQQQQQMQQPAPPTGGGGGGGMAPPSGEIRP